MGFLDKIGSALKGAWNGLTGGQGLFGAVTSPTGVNPYSITSLVPKAYAQTPSSSPSSSSNTTKTPTLFSPPTVTNNGGNGGQTTKTSQNNQQTSNPVIDAATLALNAAKNQYSFLSGQLKNDQTDLGTQKDSLLSQIGSMYDNTIQNAKDTLASNIDTLNTSKDTVTQGYEGLKNEQGRLLTDTQRQNRQTARALGDLGSSFYENLQSDASANTSKNISNFSDEEQSQLDQIANEITNENTTTNTKVQNLNDLETQAKQDIVDKYQSSWNNIENDLASTGMNSQQAYDQINNEMQSTLDNISYYMNQYKTDVLNTGQSNISQNDITNYLTNARQGFGSLSAINSNANPIGNSTALGNAQADIVAMQNSGADPTTIVGNIQQKYGLDPTTIQGMMAAAGVNSSPNSSTLSGLFPTTGS